jgi:hypothetical protein
MGLQIGRALLHFLAFLLLQDFVQVEPLSVGKYHLIDHWN